MDRLRGLSGTLMALEESLTQAPTEPTLCLLCIHITTIRTLGSIWQRPPNSLAKLLHCTVGLLHSLCTGLCLCCATVAAPQLPHTAPYVRMVCDMAYSAADSVCTVQAAVVIAKPGY